MNMNLQNVLIASALMMLVSTGTGAPEPAHSPTTQINRLDGEGWLIATDDKNQGREEKWFAAPRHEAKPTAVPGALQEAFPSYHGLVWYWKTFDAPRNPDPQGRYLLRFESVDYKADVWVNGKEVGSHEDAEEPFVLDVTDAVRSGTGNLLAVRVLNPNNKPVDGITLNQTAKGAKILAPDPGMDWNFGGILESVELLAAPAVRIDDLHVVPNWQTGEIEVNATLRNAGKQAGKVRLGLTVAPATRGENADETALEMTAPVGESVLKGKLRVPQHRLWTLDDPFLYRVSARLQAEGSPVADEQSVRCGFRNFDFTNGYFRLNGNRIFLKSGLRCWGTPIKLHCSQDLQMLRRDIIYAKTMGFNTIRHLSAAASRAELDLCDELGVLIMQDAACSWLMGDSPKMPERFDRSLLGIVRRDRNHPCIAIWYFLNETKDGPVFRQAVDALPKVRELDNTRVCLLNSGRFDNMPEEIGGLSRPGSKTWDVLGLEDVHKYLNVPYREPEINWLQTEGSKDKRPVFLSENGIASAEDLPTLVRYYERLNATDKMDAIYYRGMLDQFMADWSRWHLDSVFGRPEDYFKAALTANASQRRLGMNAFRANPYLVGYSMTALHDEGKCGEGPITFLRDLKPGAVDAIRTGFAPLKWCLFAEPQTVYRGGKIKAKVVLANEDALRPGEYSVEVAVFDPNQSQVLKEIVPLHIADPKTDPAFAQAVWDKEVPIDGPAGRYRLTARFVSGASAVDDEAEFFVVDAQQMPEVKAKVALWGNDPELEAWLKAKGIACRPFAPEASPDGAIILLSGNRLVNRPLLDAFSRRIEQGATAIMLKPRTTVTDESARMPARWTVFEKFGKETPEPEPGQLTSIPETFQLGGQTGKRHEVEVAEDGSCPDLLPLWGGGKTPLEGTVKGSKAVAYLYVPFKIQHDGSYEIKFGADYWYKAWLDGKAVSDTLRTGNEGGNAAFNKHGALVDLKEGSHLLVVKVISGALACRLRLSICEQDALAAFLSPGVKSTDTCAGFYHRDDWARRHPIFDGLPTGLLDWVTYRNIVPHEGICLDHVDAADEVVCGAITTSYGYNSGPYVAVHRHGAGRIVLNTLNIRENLGNDPVAERLLRNLLNYAAAKPAKP